VGCGLDCWNEETDTESETSTVKGSGFALGTLIGSRILYELVHLPSSEKDLDIGTARSVGGGALLVIGSRIAGGCISGHGISGMSMLSVSSIITVVSMFAGGIALEALTG
jgi:uncharacterized membrane protein YedE/YeeE